MSKVYSTNKNPESYKTYASEEHLVEQKGKESQHNRLDIFLLCFKFRGYAKTVDAYTDFIEIIKI
jgi:hypothetical protein